MKLKPEEITAVIKEQIENYDSATAEEIIQQTKRSLG